MLAYMLYMVKCIISMISSIFLYQKDVTVPDEGYTAKPEKNVMRYTLGAREKRYKKGQNRAAKNLLRSPIPDVGEPYF
jgi:hypothetical protein